MSNLTEIHLYQKKQTLVITYDDGQCFSLSCEYLRVYSPSAEVRGHGAGQAKLQMGKRYVNITSIEPVGNYAVKLIFDDGHDSGIYTWDYLYELGCKQALYWDDYLQRLQAAGATREPS